MYGGGIRNYLKNGKLSCLVPYFLASITFNFIPLTLSGKIPCCVNKPICLGNLKKDLDIFATSWKNTENPARQERP
jgi:hypothetical protein